MNICSFSTSKFWTYSTFHREKYSFSEVSNVAVTSCAKLLALGQSTSQTLIGCSPFSCPCKVQKFGKKILCRNTLACCVQVQVYFQPWRIMEPIQVKSSCMKNMKCIQIPGMSKSSYAQFKYGNTDLLFLSPGMKNILYELRSCIVLEVHWSQWLWIKGYHVETGMEWKSKDYSRV